MKTYLHVCDFCHNEFQSKRSDNIFCNDYCKTRAWRMGQDFVRIEVMLSEHLVKERYYVPQSKECAIFLIWLGQDDGAGGRKRFADVYISKRYSLELARELLKKRWGSRQGSVYFRLFHQKFTDNRDSNSLN